MKKLYLLLSFDHELSLGRARSYRENLFRPTDRLLELADEIEVPITLFTDVCCALRFRDWDRERFFNPFREQLEQAIDRGHDVQLHLHPHWLDSHYRDGEFIPANTYSLGSFRDRQPPDDIPGIVRRGTELLNEICRPRDQNYRCIAYRAGGYCLSPETDAILSALYDHGIRIESSIGKGNRLKSKLWSVDHREMPADANWYIDPQGPLHQPARSGLYEIPIATRPRTPWNNMPFLAKRILYRGRLHDCGGSPINAGGNTSWKDKAKRLFPRAAWMLGFDSHAYTVSDLMKTLRYHVDAHARDPMIACSAVSHPKFMGRYALTLMKKFVERVKSDYGNEVQFCTYQQFHEEVLSSRKRSESTSTTPRSPALHGGEG